MPTIPLDRRTAIDLADDLQADGNHQAFIGYHGDADRLHQAAAELADLLVATDGDITLDPDVHAAVDYARERGVL